MNERSVVELTFKTTHAASEIVAFWLQEAGALGVTIVDPEEIRADLARGGDGLGHLAPAVRDYIHLHRLYRSESPA